MFFCPPAVLWWWLPSAAALLAYLPAINLTEWRSRSSFNYFSDLAAVPAAVPATESPMEQAHVTPASQATVSSLSASLELVKYNGNPCTFI